MVAFSMQKKSSFSIIICCYNAAKRLPVTLEYLSKLDIVDIDCELIVVDNNSNDDTFEVVNNCWRLFNNPFELKYLKQPQPGKTNAWNLGVENATGDYMVMCDDDNWLPVDFLKKAIPILQIDPKIAMFGVKSIGIFEEELPGWAVSIHSYWAIGSQYKQSGYVTNEHKKLWGAGCIFKRQALINLAKFAYKQKFSGLKKEGMAEDHELFILLRLIGYKMYYCDEIEIKHFMPKGRITWHNYLETVKFSALNSWKFDAYEKELNNKTGVKAYLQSGVLYQVYLSILMLVKKENGIKSFFKNPKQDSPSELVYNYFLKYRIFGLLKSFFKYNTEIAVFQKSTIAAFKAEEQ